MKIFIPILTLIAATAVPAQILRGVVDIHMHSDPDSVPRSIDAFGAVRAAAAAGERAVVLKNHYDPTAGLAWLVSNQVPGIVVYGGIALNLTVGGINPHAVEHMTKVKGGLGRVVWMPTFDSENQVRFNKETRASVSVSRGGALLPAVKEVIAIIAKNNLVLATGHSTAAEDVLLVKEARARGVKHIVVTHGMLAPISMATAQMKEAAAMGAYIEFVSNAVIGKTQTIKAEDYWKAIREVGPAHCIISSDFGQAGNPIHPDGLAQMFAALRKAGFSQAEVDQMSKANPAKLLGLA